MSKMSSHKLHLSSRVTVKLFHKYLPACGCAANTGSTIGKKVYFKQTSLACSIKPTSTLCSLNNRNWFANSMCNRGILYNYNQKGSLHSFVEAYISAYQSLSGSAVVITSQNFLIDFHNKSGLPWWASISVTTLILRSLFTVPLTLYQQYILAKVENLKPELEDITEELQKETTIAARLYSLKPETATLMYRKSLKKQWKLLLERENCHPAKAFIVVFFQIPLWVVLSMSIRNLVMMRPNHDEAALQIFNQLQNEGLLWIHNLILPDSFMIVPALNTIMLLSIVEINQLMYTGKAPIYKRFATNIWRLSAIIIFPLGCVVPSCLSFYWLTSSVFGLCQNLVLMSPRVKILAGVPKTPTTIIKPYSHLWNQLQVRLKLLPPPKM